MSDNKLRKDSRWDNKTRAGIGWRGLYWLFKYFQYMFIIIFIEKKDIY